MKTQQLISMPGEPSTQLCRLDELKMRATFKRPHNDCIYIKISSNDYNVFDFYNDCPIYLHDDTMVQEIEVDPVRWWIK